MSKLKSGLLSAGGIVVGIVTVRALRKRRSGAEDAGGSNDVGSVENEETDVETPETDVESVENEETDVETPETDGVEPSGKEGPETAGEHAEIAAEHALLAVEKSIKDRMEE